MSSMATSHGWSISSSGSDDSGSELSSKHGKKFRSPQNIKKQMKNKKRSVDSKTSSSEKRQKLESSSNDPLEIWHASSPHNLLLSTVQGISPKYNNISSPISSIGIQQILSPGFGEILESVQFNYCIDMEWLIQQYPTSVRSKPLLVVHGEQGPSFNQMKNDAKMYPNIEFCRVDLPPYGTHHTKMMFLRYQEGIRIIILTANLVQKDWYQKTQGMWISPVFPLKHDKNDLENCTTNFKLDMIQYLQQYPKHKTLANWIDLIKSHDLSSVKVFLIPSVPGRHKDISLNKWGHTKLRKVLSSHLKKPEDDFDLIAQFSSIGSLGSDKNKWLCEEWLTSLSACKGTSLKRKQTKIKLVFPCIEDVRKSLEGYPAGASIPYSRKTAEKQVWLENFFHKWRADHIGRTVAAPHIKSYARISKDNSKALWLLITSSNLSKAAWGGFEKKGTQLAIRSYELGVLFIPQFFHTDTFDFSLKTDDENSITMPFSLPLSQYEPTDSPWLWDVSHKRLPDRNGNMWCPPGT